MSALLAAVAAAPALSIDRTQGLGILEGAVVDGTYRVLRRLGGGGMGIVYLAEHVELQTRLVLTTVEPPPDPDARPEISQV